MRRIGYVEYLWNGFLMPPVAWLLLAGLLVSPFLIRGRPLVVPTLLALIGGYVGFTNFPDVHGRHFAPLVGPAAVLAVAPFVPLRLLWRRLPLVVASALTVGSLAYALTWRLDVGAPTDRLRMQDTEIGGAIPAPDLDALRDRLSHPPHWRWTALQPPDEPWPLPEAFDDAVADARSRSGQAQPALSVLANDPLVEGDGLLLLGIERYEGGDVGAFAPFKQGELPALLRDRASSWFYGIERVPVGQAPSPWWRQAGFIEVKRYDAGAQERRRSTEMVLLRLAGGPGGG